MYRLVFQLKHLNRIYTHAHAQCTIREHAPIVVLTLINVFKVSLLT